MKEIDQDFAGYARYTGKNRKLKKLFGEYTNLYNTEGFYVLTEEGEQVVISGKEWELLLDTVEDAKSLKNKK